MEYLLGMPVIASPTDVAFYELVHRLLGDMPEGVVERRDAIRQPFQTTQRIAPRHGGEYPPASAFFEVYCGDLSPKGFSFFLPKPPDFQELVAGFGQPPGVIYLAAKVAHCRHTLVDPRDPTLRETVPGLCRQIEAEDGQTPRRMMLVGCHFVERLGR